MKRIKAIIIDKYKVVAGFVADIKGEKLLIKDGNEFGAILTGSASRFSDLKPGDLVVAAVDDDWGVVELEQANHTFLIDLGGKKGQIACRVGRVGPVDKGAKGQTIVSFPEASGAATKWKKVSFWNGREGDLADTSVTDFRKTTGPDGKQVSPYMLIIGKKAGDKFVNGVAYLQVRRPTA